MGLVRTQNDSSFSGGRTWCRRRFPSLLGMQTALRNQSTRQQDGCNSPRIVGVGDSLQNLGQSLSRRGQCGNAVEMHQQVRGPKSARHVGGLLSVDGFAWRRLVVVASIGFDWRRMVVVASIGAE